MTVSHLQLFGTGLASGLLGFAHCLGMCGGFVLLLAQEGKGSRLAGGVLWLVGKLFGYLFLGGVAGYAGAFLKGVLGGWVLFQKALALTVGGVLVLAALSLLGLVPVRKESSAGGSIVSLCYARAFGAAGGGAPLLLGIATAFLPCPIVLALAACAVQQGTVTGGMATMAGLGVGSSLPLLVLGAAGGRVPLTGRRWGPRLAGVTLLIVGATTMLRGTPFFHHLFGGADQGASYGAHLKGSLSGEAHHEGGNGHH